MRDHPEALGSTTEERIFNAALALPLAMRRDFVDRSCEGDPAGFSHVMALLNASEKNGAFLDLPAPAAVLREIGSAVSSLPDPAPGDRVGRYCLIERIGEGGCGIVYGADQLEPVRRRVALKIIRLGMDTREFIARFEAEQQALALMDHPNIAHVYDAGATPGGRPFLVMELVRGIAITRFCDEQRLSLRDRLQLFVKVCGAIQHAHQKGVIHRDLKPSNILVALADGTPVPKVIDFGIAKATSRPLTNKSLTTQCYAFMGTPAYTSPEQAEIGAHDVDTRSDVYSLGALLYELLTGCPPHDRASLERGSFDEMRRIVREARVARPSDRVSALLPEARAVVAAQREIDAEKLSLQLRSELDWIVMRCLEKDRARRYETANALAQDVRRHLEHEPVVARPPSRAYRLSTFMRRYRTPVFAAIAVGLSLVGGLIAAGILLVREKTMRTRAVAAEQAEGKMRQLAELQAQQMQTAARKSRQVAQFLKDMLGAVAPSVARGRDTTLLRDVLDTNIRRLDTDLRDQPEVAASLRHTLATAFREVGDYDRAATLWRQAIAARRALGDDGSVELASTLHELGSLLGVMNQVAEAETTLEEALAIRRRTLGRDHFDVGTTLAALAYNIGSNRSAREREALLREAVAIQRMYPGRGDDELAQTLMILGYVLFADSRNDEAIPVLRESIKMRRELYPGPHPRLAESLEMLARSMYSWTGGPAGKSNEARLLRRDVLQMVREVRGPANGKLIAALLAFIPKRHAPDFFDADLRLCRQVFDDLQRTLPRDSPDLAVAQLALASGIDLEPGKSAEAAALADDAVARIRRARENGVSPHRDTSAAMQAFVQQTQAAGRPHYALRMGEELQADVNFGSVLTYGTPIARTLGRTYFDLGRYHEAISMLEISARAERSPWRPLWRPAQRAFVFIDFAFLGEAYRKVGDVSASRRILEEGLAWTTNVENRNDRAQAARAAVRGELGFTAIAESKFTEAEALFRQALVEYDAEPAAINRWDLHRPRGRMVIGLGQALAGQGKFPEAEPLVVEGFLDLMAKRRALLGESTRMLRESLEAVVQVYRAAGKPEKVTEWQEKRIEL